MERGEGTGVKVPEWEISGLAGDSVQCSGPSLHEKVRQVTALVDHVEGHVHGIELLLRSVRRPYLGHDLKQPGVSEVADIPLAVFLRQEVQELFVIRVDALLRQLVGKSIGVVSAQGIGHAKPGNQADHVLRNLLH